MKLTPPLTSPMSTFPEIREAHPGHVLLADLQPMGGSYTAVCLWARVVRRAVPEGPRADLRRDAAGLDDCRPRLLLPQPHRCHLLRHARCGCRGVLGQPDQRDRRNRRPEAHARADEGPWKVPGAQVHRLHRPARRWRQGQARGRRPEGADGTIGFLRSF